MSTFIIRNKETLKQWVADSGKSSWKKGGHAKAAWKQSTKNVPRELQYTKYIMHPRYEPLKFDDQNVYEVVELFSTQEKVDASNAQKLKEIKFVLTTEDSAEKMLHQIEDIVFGG